MSKPDQQKLEALGLLFAQTRTNQDLSLEGLSEQLRISEYHLEALEQALVNRLPEPVYVRGFVRKYAQALHLEKNPVVLEFLNQMPIVEPTVVPTAIPAKREKRPTSPLVKALAYGLVAALAVVMLSAGLRTYLPQATVVGIEPATSSPVAPQTPPATTNPAETPPLLTTTTPSPNPPVASSNPTAPAPTLPTAPLAAKVPLRLAMNVMSDSWLRVVVDGKTQFEGVLAKGNNRTWEGQKNLKVRLGNAGGVILTYNDQLIGPIGKPGQVAEKEFNR